MQVTRRSLLGGAIAGAGVAAGTVLVRGVPSPEGLRRMARRAASPELPEADPGPLEPPTLAALLAVARALVGDAAQEPRYAELFRSRAETLRGYRQVYRRFVERLAESSTGPDESLAGLQALPPERPRSAVTRLAPPGRLTRLALGLSGSERALFRRYVVLETLELYRATDAWPALGYGSWPGQPRGLEAYRRPPEGVEAPP
ncbi:MAG: hypothetical protein ACOC7L_02215 [Acidobacteriota bacterium]